MNAEREDAREVVFERDNYRCVFCGKPAVDAHHLLERHLWQADEHFGYIPANLISVCSDCHLMCEYTWITVEEGRQAAGITKVIVPSQLYEDQSYDKWGNPILADGRRAMGELFMFEQVKRVLRLANVLDQVVPYMKYPRTFHLPWSHPTKDDKLIQSLDLLEHSPIVVTEKLDGENTSMYTDYIHARSLDSQSAEYRSWVKSFWAKKSQDIPIGYRICGENMYAQHSIAYENLESYFYGFSFWYYDYCFSWNETIEWFQLLDIPIVPVLYSGTWNEEVLKELAKDNTREGYVVRIANDFKYAGFKNCVAKYVRKDHLKTNQRWDQRIIKNRLAFV